MDPTLQRLGDLCIAREVFDQFVRLDVSGPPRLRDLLNLVDATHTDSQQWRGKHILLAMGNLDSAPDSFGQALFGEHIGTRLAHIRKLALVLPGDAPAAAIERLARSKGANLRVFSEEGEAIAWLAPSPAGRH